MEDNIQNPEQVLQQAAAESTANEQKYGNLPEQFKTLAEGAANSATFGNSTALERRLGLALTGKDPAEDIKARRAENPISYGIGQIAGIMGPGAGSAIAETGAAFGKLAGGSALKQA